MRRFILSLASITALLLNSALHALAQTSVDRRDEPWQASWPALVSGLQAWMTTGTVAAATVLLAGAHRAASQTTAPRLIIVAAPINYDVQQERGSLQPAAGKRFVGVSVAKTDTVQVRFEADSAVLTASAGERLALAAFCSDSLGKDCVPISLLRMGQILGAYGTNGEGYSLVKNANTGVVTLARRGPRGTPFVLVYEAPVEARQVTFTFGVSAAVTLTIPATGARRGGADMAGRQVNRLEVLAAVRTESLKTPFGSFMPSNKVDNVMILVKIRGLSPAAFDSIAKDQRAIVAGDRRSPVEYTLHFETGERELAFSVPRNVAEFKLVLGSNAPVAVQPRPGVLKELTSPLPRQ